MSADGLTHFDAAGAARMVDVGAKAETDRTAVASAVVRMLPETRQRIQDGTASKKGDVLAVARLAGIMAAKKTGDLIPLCHPLPLTSVAVDFSFPDDPALIRVEARVRVFARTGVEMEALTAVSVAALTVYDMCKAVDRGMILERVQLEEKAGGQSGPFRRPAD
ncbi:cyclic pyranopterin monophosphate synthase MoaC [Limnoglobus roseus]|uniref:Cyclic pyranopterin monophosphate synthase n=1 Tax=Limnoglobus roseus TaxID=2598579 RepID=A0A5C1AD03_9BACT|nr:cyclic pyranopterin monophosphate synthase MoaC [Limnoglobus roseus]QEL15652.1 cyclic pyranopterin monophosphate synthase MoaC [Limnoglobus roseus]